MSLVVYEHPLNERVRTLLRLEFLLAQLEQHKDVKSTANILPFFKTIFECIEVLERNDVRPILTTQLDVLEKSLVRWSAHPEVLDSSLQDKLQEAVCLQTKVANMNKACQQLKEDKFLASLRARISVAGGAVDYDLPQFHYWRLKKENERQADVEEWYNILEPIHKALNFALLFLRESSSFVLLKAENGFYQDSCAEQVSLLRIRYDLSKGIFPTVSGSKHRYSISFMAPDKASVKTSVNDNIEFELSSC